MGELFQKLPYKEGTNSVLLRETPNGNAHIVIDITDGQEISDVPSFTQGFHVWQEDKTSNSNVQKEQLTRFCGAENKNASISTLTDREEYSYTALSPECRCKECIIFYPEENHWHMMHDFRKKKWKTANNDVTDEGVFHSQDKAEQ